MVARKGLFLHLHLFGVHIGNIVAAGPDRPDRHGKKTVLALKADAHQLLSVSRTACQPHKTGIGLGHIAPLQG